MKWNLEIPNVKVYHLWFDTNVITLHIRVSCSLNIIRLYSELYGILIYANDHYWHKIVWKYR